MDYWESCVREALEDAGITATEDQVDTIIGWVEGAHENYGMANGYDVIGSPAETEVEELKRQIRRMEQEHEEQLDGIRKGVARRRGVNMTDVNIDRGGNVTYEEG